MRYTETVEIRGHIMDTGVLARVLDEVLEYGRDFVLVGSVRDDGPLPDVYADVIAGQRAMRAQLAGVGFCIVVATMLHGIATEQLARELVAGYRGPEA